MIARNRLLHVGSIGSQTEFLVLAWKTDRLRLDRSQTFWLSATPTRPGTHGAFDTGPHLAMVADFTRTTRSGPGLRVVNTHVGHSPFERGRAREVLRMLVDHPLRSGRRIDILLGDLNATPDNALIRGLLAPRVAQPGLRDAWTEARVRSGPSTTYHWARPQRDFLPLRIDYVFLRGPVRANAARVEGRAHGGAVASDHDALIVDLEIDDTAD